MSSESQIERVIKSLPHGVVRQSKHPHVLEIKWRRKGSETHRLQLVQQLCERSPVVLIWLKDLNEEIRKTLGTPMCTSGGAGFWLLSKATSLSLLLDGLDEGGWALFFFSKLPEDSLKVPEFLCAKPEDVGSMLHATGAKAVILSWYDDIEWLVAFEPNM